MKAHCRTGGGIVNEEGREMEGCPKSHEDNSQEGADG